MNLVIFQCGLLDFYCKLISRFSSRDWNGGHATRSFMCNQCYKIIIIIASFLLGIINSMVLNHHFGMKIKGILLCVTREWAELVKVVGKTFVFAPYLAPINCVHFYNGATIRN